MYSAQRIPARRKVSLLAYDQRLGDVLNLLLQPLDVLYYVSGNQIVLMKKGRGKQHFCQSWKISRTVKKISEDKK